jgi:hypothetical protein
MNKNVLILQNDFEQKSYYFSRKQRMNEPRAFLPTFFSVAAKNLHVIVGAATNDELGLVPVAAEDSV